MSDLRTFLLARIDEREADPWWPDLDIRGSDRAVGPAERDQLAADQKSWDSFVQADCEAKRAIVDRHRQYAHTGFCECCFDDYPCADLRALGAIYDQHPDYREEWRP